MTIDVELTAQEDRNSKASIFFVKVPVSVSTRIRTTHRCPCTAAGRVSFATTRPVDEKHYIGGTATGAEFMSRGRDIEITFDQPRETVFQDGRADNESVSRFLPAA